MPGITQLLLLFVVLGGAITGPLRPLSSSNSRLIAAAIGLIGLGLYFGCWFTGLIPVTSARNHIAAGEYELFEERRALRAQREFLIAAEADPWSADPYRQLAQLSLLQVATAGSDNAAFDRALAWERAAIERDPRFAGGYRQLGEMFLAKFGRSEAQDDAKSAADAFLQAAALYPNHAHLQAELAESLWRSGSRHAAHFAAQRAGELDDINEKAGHSDKRLPAVKQDLMRRIMVETGEKAN
jgi:tetratricopeptide (TPR) repeat protein